MWRSICDLLTNSPDFLKQSLNIFSCRLDGATRVALHGRHNLALWVREAALNIPCLTDQQLFVRSNIEFQHFFEVLKLMLGQKLPLVERLDILR